jgi:translation initiation factor 2B subunit (eIF-2B alpha/beta/delta family)
MSTKKVGSMDKLQELISNIKRDKAGGSKATAQSVANIFRKVVKAGKWTEPKDLLKLVKQMGTKLMEADPMAFYIGNIVKRIIHTIRVQCKNMNIPLLEEKERTEGDQVSTTLYLCMC